MDIRLYASIMLVNDRREVLLVREGKEKVHGLWNLPGGHVEPGEEFAEAAKRETREETGLDVQPSGLMKIFCGQDVGSLHAIFYATDFSGSIYLSDPHILDAQWIPIAQIKTMDNELLHPHKFHSLLQLLEEGRMMGVDVFQYQK